MYRKLGYLRQIPTLLSKYLTQRKCNQIVFIQFEIKMHVMKMQVKKQKPRMKYCLRSNDLDYAENKKSRNENEIWTFLQVIVVCIYFYWYIFKLHATKDNSRVTAEKRATIMEKILKAVDRPICFFFSFVLFLFLNHETHLFQIVYLIFEPFLRRIIEGIHAVTTFIDF